MKRRNPFVIYGYEGPDTFCDRKAETEKLKAAVENGRNVTLLAERRIGKTGLIRHFFDGLRREGRWATVYVDIFATTDLLEFTSQFASAVVGSMDTRLDKANIARTGVLDTKSYGDVLHRSWVFRSVGYGNDELYWKDMVSNLRLIGYDHVLSIEHEDSLMSQNEGLTKAVNILKDALITEDTAAMWWV